ncbi:MAG TPA: TlpA disulfide reductase family protein [Gallionellaceae bacterium]|nr:TlpA disulfide reductase family protein [Gallionellaceae bacterium]
MNFIASLRSPAPHAIRSALHLALLLSALFAAQSALAGGWTLKDTRGVSHTLAHEKGKWVLVNFWAPWCPPCLAEMPGFSAMQRKHRDLQVIGVAVMYRNDADVLAVVNKQKLAYPVVLGNDDISSEFGELSGLPTSFLYDPSGKRVGRHEGPLTPQALEHVMAHAPDAKGVFVRGD